jgi:(p)ppGpp synthase/HD superfamily hydrolase
MIFKAIEFAAKAHAGQYRKGTGIPYITHPLNVAKILIECKCREPVVSAGILHDTLEDTRVTDNDLITLFGTEVFELVSAVSEPNKSDYTWENRKSHTIKRLKEASQEILMLSLADKCDNMQTICDDYEILGDRLWKRFNRPKEKQKWYYETLAAIFSERLQQDGTEKLVDRFRSNINRVFA